MANKLDLNIDNYDIKKIKEMFSLQGTYNKDNILQRCKQLKDNVMSDDSMIISKKIQLNEFLDRASLKLIRSISGDLDKQFNLFPKAFSHLKNTIIPGNGSGLIIEPPSTRAGLLNRNKDNGRLIDSASQPPGIVNQLKVKTIKKTINIDTRFRPHYYDTLSTNFIVTLPLKVNKAVSMRITSFEIPITWYAVSLFTGNSFFKIEWDWNGSDFNKTGIVIIPDGNYEPYWQKATNATDLASTVNTFMHALDPTDVKLQNIIYKVDQTTGKSIFKWNPSGPVTPEPFRITFSIRKDGSYDEAIAIQFKLGWLFGYHQESYTSEEIISEGICYMKSPKYAFICINDFNQSVSDYFVSAFDTSVLQSDIIARINLTFIQQNQGVYQSGQEDGFSTQINRQRNYFGPVDIERLEIKLLDEYGRIINLNNMDWSFALTMECLYES